MHKYFKMIEQEANRGPDFASIMDLLQAMAMDAGYERKLCTFKNGKTRLRTTYNKPFNSSLTAKILLFYKPLFQAKLLRYPLLKEHYVDIINKTFEVAMISLDLSKINSDKALHSYINKTLQGRICDMLRAHGSIPDLIEGNNSKHTRMSTAVVYRALSLDQMQESIGFDITDSMTPEFSDLVMDLKEKLQDNPMGLRLLQAALTSSSPIGLHSIDKYVSLDKSECTEENRKFLTEAYNIIASTLSSAMGMPRRHIRTVAYSMAKEDV